MSGRRTPPAYPAGAGRLKALAVLAMMNFRVRKAPCPKDTLNKRAVQEESGLTYPLVTKLSLVTGLGEKLPFRGEGGNGYRFTIEFV